MNFRKEQQKEKKAMKVTYNQLLYGFDQEFTKNRKRVNYDSVIYPIIKEMKVTAHIQCLIFGYSPIIPNTTPEKSLAKINEFIMVKKVLHSCSFPVEDSSYIYPEIMKSILFEMKMSVRLFKLCKAWEENEDISKSIKVHDKKQEYSEKCQIENNLPYLSKFVSDSYRNDHL